MQLFREIRGSLIVKILIIGRKTIRTATQQSFITLWRHLFETIVKTTFFPKLFILSNLIMNVVG